MDVTVSPLTLERWPALESLFGPAGVASAFARHGFAVVARRKPDRPVMRRSLSASG